MKRQFLDQCPLFPFFFFWWCSRFSLPGFFIAFRFGVILFLLFAFFLCVFSFYRLFLLDFVYVCVYSFSKASVLLHSEGTYRIEKQFVQTLEFRWRIFGKGEENKIKNLMGKKASTVYKYLNWNMFIDLNKKYPFESVDLLNEYFKWFKWECDSNLFRNLFYFYWYFHCIV